MTYTYKPTGVCSQLFEFEIENDIIKSAKIMGGCSGNTQGVCKLITGMNIDDVIDKLQGIKCGFKNTSCPDQITKALIQYKKETK